MTRGSRPHRSLNPSRAAELRTKKPLDRSRSNYTAVSTKVVQKSVKAFATMPKGSLGNTQSGNMDSELVLKFIGYFLDYHSALSRTFLAFFGQPLSKQLYVKKASIYKQT